MRGYCGPGADAGSRRLAERVDTLEADLIAEIARREAEPGLRAAQVAAKNEF